MMARALPDFSQSPECESDALTADFYLVFVGQVLAQKWDHPDGRSVTKLARVLIHDLTNQWVNNLLRRAWPSLARAISDPQLGGQFIPRFKACRPGIDDLARYSQATSSTLSPSASQIRA
jgi:hypothetical protein